MDSISRRRRAVLGATCACTLGFLTLAEAGCAARREPGGLALSKWDAAAVRRARAGASERLLGSECQKLLDDYTDAGGRTLREKLDRLGLTAAGYLQQLPFLDGTWTRSCRPDHVVMVAIPGRAAVYVCPAGSTSRLAQAVYQNPSRAEFAVIHEMLHTLGLGENPPASRQITARVKERCAGGPPPRNGRPSSEANVR